jgi:hypothetical protein
MNDHPDHVPTDWRAIMLLGVVASIVAALSAVALAAVLSETTIVVGVIIASTLASWFQLEHGSRPVARH